MRTVYSHWPLRTLLMARLLCSIMVGTFRWRRNRAAGSLAGDEHAQRAGHVSELLRFQLDALCTSRREAGCGIVASYRSRPRVRPNALKPRTSQPRQGS
jgi:hypothetical protein